MVATTLILLQCCLFLPQNPEDLAAWFDKEVKALPPVTENVKDPTPFVDLANKLIEAGPSKTWHLIDSFCATSPPTFMGNWDIGAAPDDPWCRLLAVLPLLFDWRTISDLGALPGQALPGNLPISRYENGYIYLARYFIRFERSPATLREALGTVDWRLFRKTPLIPCVEFEEKAAKSLAKSTGGDFDYHFRLIDMQTRAFQEAVRSRTEKPPTSVGIRKVSD